MYILVELQRDNKLCSCGSGKKYKDCCKNNNFTDDENSDS